MLKLKALEFHRNGVSGCPFYVGIVKEGTTRKIVITFDDEPSAVRTAAFDIDLLAENNIKFGENSFRGDHFHDFMLKQIKIKCGEMRG